MNFFIPQHTPETNKKLAAVNFANEIAFSKYLISFQDLITASPEDLEGVQEALGILHHCLTNVRNQISDYNYTACLPSTDDGNNFFTPMALPVLYFGGVTTTIIDNLTDAPANCVTYAAYLEIREQLAPHTNIAVRGNQYLPKTFAECFVVQKGDDNDEHVMYAYPPEELLRAAIAFTADQKKMAGQAGSNMVAMRKGIEEMRAGKQRMGNVVFPRDGAGQSGNF